LPLERPAVKPFSADGTWTRPGRVGHCRTFNFFMNIQKTYKKTFLIYHKQEGFFVLTRFKLDGKSDKKRKKC
jgi:hypothetical protein